MTTLKLKFKPAVVCGGEGRLYYQLIHNREVRLINSGYNILSEYWNNKKQEIDTKSDICLENQQIRLLQSKVKWELKQRMITIKKLEDKCGTFSADDIVMAFSRIPTCKTVFDYIQEQIDIKLQMGRIGTMKTYVNTIRRFREFRNGIDLVFDDLTADIIERYEAWLIDRRLMQNSVRFYLKTLSTLCHKAVADGLAADAGMFNRVRLSYVKTSKRAISEDYIMAIERLDLPSASYMAFARDIFMFSFYMRGMSFVDIANLKKSDLKYDMVRYSRKKTHQVLTIRWETVLDEIVSRYEHLTKDSQYMLPIIKKDDDTKYRQYQLALENINRCLKKIGKMIGLRIPLTTYVARHSWASIARNMDFPIAIISEGMGHDSYLTTQTYLDSIDTSRIDDANGMMIKRIHQER